MKGEMGVPGDQGNPGADGLPGIRGQRGQGVRFCNAIKWLIIVRHTNFSFKR